MSRYNLSAAVLLTVAFLACARALPPPGGVQDRQAPRIVSTTPETLAVMPGFDEPVVFVFDERISERGISGSILVSPQTGEVKVKRGRREIRVEIEGGWRRDVTYSVVLTPGIRDLFSNERKESAELVFSTGPPITSTAIGGAGVDRITGRPANQVMAEATRRADSLRYVTVADSQAFFTFRNLPVGIYDIVAWSDQNRNRRRDPAEMVARGQATPLRDTDTLTLDLGLVPPDTTPPRLVRAEGRDSMQIRAFTDDWLEPIVPLASYRMRILALPDSQEVGGPVRVMRPDTFQLMVTARADSIRQDSLARVAAARQDTARRDTTGADTTRADTTPPPPIAGRGGLAVPATGAAARGQAPPGRPGLPIVGPLPFQEVVVIPGRPLPPGKYLLEAEGLQNISGRPGGGGVAPFDIPEPRKPATDTTRVPPDTGSVRLRSR